MFKKAATLSECSTGKKYEPFFAVRYRAGQTNMHRIIFHRRNHKIPITNDPTLGAVLSVNAMIAGANHFNQPVIGMSANSLIDRFSVLDPRSVQSSSESPQHWFYCLKTAGGQSHYRTMTTPAAPVLFFDATAGPCSERISEGLRKKSKKILAVII
ncbi:MAG: hypothetical protein GF398_01495 [Chitinivibrionales bacterium]|nr:hypothetical protein [Chitinivibrionales bacterium]